MTKLLPNNPLEPSPIAAFGQSETPVVRLVTGSGRLSSDR